MTERDEFIARAEANPAQKAPYTFVETGRTALPSPTENLDLSRPVEGALSGYLTVIWTAETPLLVGGGEATDRDNPTNLTPLMIGGQYALPGSTIKGLVRATMEIAAFARLSFVDDFTGYTRSFTDRTWREEVNPAPGNTANGGWLFCTTNGYVLVQAVATERIEFDQLLPLLSTISDTDGWHQADMHAREQALVAAGKQGQLPASDFGRGGNHFVQLVVAGPTASADRGGDHPKRAEYLFFWPGSARRTRIDKATGDRFLASLYKDANTHSAAPEANYSALITTGGVTGFDPVDPEPLETQLANPATYGLPVFWRNPGGTEQNRCGDKPILSLTAFYRVPFKKTVHDLIGKTQVPLDDDQLDLVQALLGWAPPKPPTGRIAERKKAQKSLRSRVRFGFAYSDDAQPQRQPKTWAAPRPKPSYWPYYLKPSGPGATHPVDYNNPAAILAGRKRYPARDGTQPLPDGGDNAQTGDHRGNMEQDLTFLEAGATFTSDIRFRNISPIELGALIWAITFGDLQGNDGFRHMLGRAKAYGYGQVRAQITDDAITSHQGGPATREAALAAFTDWVRRGTGQDFDTHPTIRRLKGTAHAATGARLRNHLKFPGGQGQAVLDAYGSLKKRAQEENNGIGGQTEAPDRIIGLPPYPGVPEE